MAAKKQTALETFVEQTRGLYTMPAVAVEVLALADDPRADAGELKTCIERDPALAAKLLRVVNSSMFSPARPVADLTQAVALLGVKAVKLLALGFTLPERMFDEQTSSATAHYWQRTLRRAVAARRLAAAVHWREGEEAFITGLLADVGVAVLLQEAAEDYLPIFEGARYGELDALTAERQVFGFDRRQLTRRLLTEWRLPLSISAAIDEAADGGDVNRALGRTARLLYVAELVAAVTVDERAELWPMLNEAAERHLRLSAGDLSELDETMERETAELGGAMKFTRLGDGVTREVLDRARRLTPDAAEAAVGDLASRRREGAPTPPPPQRSPTASSPTASSPTGGVTVVTAKPTTAELRLLHDYVRAAAITCRNERASLSLCLVEVEQDQELEEESLLKTVGAACAQVDWTGALSTAVGGVRTAIVLPRCDRRRALDWFEELRLRFREAVGAEGQSVKLSVGIAAVGLPPRDLPVDEIITAAERCLYAAQSSAGDAAKSIELY